MDEPFSSLDAQTREIMQTELLRIWEQGRKTVLFVTHQIDEAVFLSDRVLVFARRPGRLQESVEIELPRPRALAIKRTPEFVALRRSHLAADRGRRARQRDRGEGVTFRPRCPLPGPPIPDGVARSADPCFIPNKKRLPGAPLRRGGNARDSGHDQDRDHAATVFDGARRLGGNHRHMSAIRSRPAGYPNRPVRFILPFGAAGVADITSRMAAEKLGDKLGQRFVVENQPGPGGIAAARAVLSQPPDGYTLGLVTNGTSISAAIYKALPFDPVKSFATISTIGSFDLVFATNAESEFKTLQDFIKAAREQPGKLNVGTINVGGTQNLAAELFKSSGRAQLPDRPVSRHARRHRCPASQRRADVGRVLCSASSRRSLDNKIRAVATSAPSGRRSSPTCRPRPRPVFPDTR